eukprot:6207136-Pleurochrysis_carterae.AAC.2
MPAFVHARASLCVRVGVFGARAYAFVHAHFTQGGHASDHWQGNSCASACGARLRMQGTSSPGGVRACVRACVRDTRWRTWARAWGLLTSMEGIVHETWRSAPSLAAESS